MNDVPFFDQPHVKLLSSHLGRVGDACFTRLYLRTESLLNGLVISITDNNSPTITISRPSRKRPILESNKSPDASDASTSKKAIVTHEIVGIARTAASKLKSYAWETLHSTHWRTVPTPARDAYALGTFLHIALTMLLSSTRRAIEEDKLKDTKLIPTPQSLPVERMVRQLDRALLLGGPLMRDDLQRLLVFLERTHSAQLYRPLQVSTSFHSIASSSSTKKTRREQCCPNGPGKRTDIPIAHCPDLHTFMTEYLEPGRPVVLRGCLDEDGWPALTRWNDLEYFNKGTPSIL